MAQRLAALPAEELKAEILHALEAGGRTSPEGGSSKAGSAKGRGMFGGRATPSPPSSFASHLDRLDAPPAEAPLEVGGITIPACERIQLDSLKLLRRIGAGAMGTMYLARWGDKQVALKAAAMSDLDAWLREVAVLRNPTPTLIPTLTPTVTRGGSCQRRHLLGHGPPVTLQQNLSVGT